MPFAVGKYIGEMPKEPYKLRSGEVKNEKTVLVAENPKFPFLYTEVAVPASYEVAKDKDGNVMIPLDQRAGFSENGQYRSLPIRNSLKTS